MIILKILFTVGGGILLAAAVLCGICKLETHIMPPLERFLEMCCHSAKEDRQ